MKDINYILEVMPHRYPFLMVDRIIGHQRKESIQTIKNVSMLIYMQLPDSVILLREI
mgnify:CR=1 FL=1